MTYENGAPSKAFNSMANATIKLEAIRDASEEENQMARAYLTRHGHLDILEILFGQE